MRGLVGLGALVMVAACSDAVGPPTEGRDLDFFAPALNGASVMAEPTTEPMPYPTPEQVPIISSKYVSGWWSGSTYTVAYGLFGGGTGYTIMPHVRILDEDGFAVLDRNGAGKSEDASLYWYMRPTGSESFTVGFDCGGSGEANVSFEVRMSAFGLTSTLLKVQQTDLAHTPQELCYPTVPPEGGGGSDSGGHYTITVCQYEAWYLPDGTLVAIVEMGCTTVEGLPLAE